jgi:transcriptional regulator with XRE-family HTH domain
VEEFRGLLLRFRGRTGLSQTQLAACAGVHQRSIQAWESGFSLPSTNSLQALIVALVQTHGFTSGDAESEARALWSAAEQSSSRQHPSFDARWFVEIQGGSSVQGEPEPRDWADAPDTTSFLGRRAELALLHRIVIDQRAGMVIIGGMGGVGKTTLAARLAREAAPKFQRVYWRSMRAAPTFSDWSAGVIAFLGGQQRVLPDGDNARIGLLMELLRARRCLLVLDNLEVLIQPGRTDGAFRPEHQPYADFLETVASRAHASCVVLTSRDIPSVLVQSGTPLVELGGLEVEDARAMLDDKSLAGDDRVWSELVERFGGNALVLRVVGDSIRQLFNGDIAEFMEQVPSGTMVGGIRRLLDSQFYRLTQAEREIVRLLAIARDPVSFAQISAALIPRTCLSHVLEAIESLRHRSFIESAASSYGFTLRSAVREYVTSQLEGVADNETTGGQSDALLMWPASNRAECLPARGHLLAV